MTEHATQTLQNAEEDENGHMVWEHEVPAAAGGMTSEKIDGTILFQPGERQTGDLNVLIVEAELAKRGEHGGNPATPANGEIMDEFLSRIEETDLQPAWEVVEDSEFP